MDINKGRFSPINIEKFIKSFSVTEDIFNILKLSDDVVVLKLTDEKIIIFTKDKRREMSNKVRIESGEFTKKWGEIMRLWYKRRDLVKLGWKNRIYLNKKFIFEKSLRWKKISVSFCI